LKGEKPMSLLKFACFWATATLVGCGQVSEEPSRNDPGQPETVGSASAPVKYAAFEISWSQPSPQALAARAQRVAGVLLQRDLPAEPFTAAVPATLPSNLGFRTNEADTGELLDVRYFLDADDLRVSNPALDSDTSTRRDIGRDAARQIFEQTFAGLANAGLVDRSDYDLGAAQASVTTTTLGSSQTESETVITNSYDFLARRTLNGIPFSNAGVRVRVHRGGRVTAIRIGGAQVASQRGGTTPSIHALATTGGGSEGLKEMPTGAGFVFESTVDTQRLAARFKKEAAHGIADRSGVMYMLPLSAKIGAANKAVVEPLYVVSYANKVGDIVARRRYLGYSLRDPQAPPTDLSEKPAPQANGDSRE
jgi:hypothetical protein